MSLQNNLKILVEYKIKFKWLGGKSPLSHFVCKLEVVVDND
jgi:hypothetical protein